ncbi:MAG: tRNA (cytidine(34)-2'-O)-methyltransferase [Lachnospirales bacterium]
MLNIVLLSPEKPHNTGAIGRTCMCTNSKLHIIKPFSFDLSDKGVKRAGLDYWHRVDVTVYENYEEFLFKNNYPNVYYATTKALQTYADVTYKDNDFIFFGSEGSGIPEEILVANKNNCIRIPMIENERSLNLANSASILLYEALRQNDFFELEKKGNLHKLKWN